MADSPPVLRGVVHGRFIELERDPGLPDGQEVAVTVEPVPVSTAASPPTSLSDEARRRWEEARAQVKDLPPGEGLRRAFGAWAEDVVEVDRLLEWTYAQRKLERRSPGR